MRLRMKAMRGEAEHRPGAERRRAARAVGGNAWRIGVRTGLATALSFTALAIADAPTAQADTSLFSIGTGEVAGVYYPAGGAICKLVNKGRKSHGMRCVADSTEGSIENLTALRAGEIDFGLVQSDWQSHALSGVERFAEAGPFPELRSVMALHAEPATLIARRDSGVGALEDLAGKRLHAGGPGSGSRGTWEALAQSLGWGPAELTPVEGLDFDAARDALCDDELDAAFFLLGHPSGLAMRTLAYCDVALVDVTGAAVEALMADEPYYQRARIPARIYGDNPEVRSFGVAATLVTHAETPDDVVYTLVKAVFEDLRGFKRQHPALGDLEAERMIQDGLTAPLHPGARRYYEERGWL